jgi:hypothetical protein
MCIAQCGLAMNCTICGKPSLPGKSLCGPCKAALKRARYVTVQEDPRPSISVWAPRRKHRRNPDGASARNASAEPERRTSRERAANPPPTGTRLTGRHLLIGGIAIAALGLSVFAALRQSTTRSAATTEVAAPSPAPTVPESTAAAPLPSPTPAVVADLPVRGAAPPTTVPDTSGHADDILPGRTPAKAPGAGRGRSAALSLTPSATSVAEPELVVIPQEPPKPAPAPARPPVDRWQTMSDALGNCDREGALNGFICGQRVRIQYCDGYWGKVPQCPGAISNLDHGP